MSQITNSQQVSSTVSMPPAATGRELSGTCLFAWAKGDAISPLAMASRDAVWEVPLVLSGELSAEERSQRRISYKLCGTGLVSRLLYLPSDAAVISFSK